MTKSVTAFMTKLFELQLQSKDSFVLGSFFCVLKIQAQCISGFAEESFTSFRRQLTIIYKFVIINTFSTLINLVWLYLKFAFKEMKNAIVRICPGFVRKASTEVTRGRGLHRNVQYVRVNYFLVKPSSPHPIWFKIIPFNCCPEDVPIRGGGH